MSRRLLLVISITLGSLCLTACEGSPSLAAESRGAATHPTVQAAPDVTRTPSGIFISTSVRPTATLSGATTASEPNPIAVIIQGRVFDAGRGQRLDTAR